MSEPKIFLLFPTSTKRVVVRRRGLGTRVFTGDRRVGLGMEFCSGDEGRPILNRVTDVIPLVMQDIVGLSTPADDKC
jgi:hypothetical protein